MTKKALGKGLGAFIPEEFGILKEDRYAEVEIEKVQPNPQQPRTIFDDPVSYTHLTLPTIYSV